MTNCRHKSHDSSLSSQDELHFWFDCKLQSRNVLKAITLSTWLRERDTDHYLQSLHRKTSDKLRHIYWKGLRNHRLQATLGVNYQQIPRDNNHVIQRPTSSQTNPRELLPPYKNRRKQHQRVQKSTGNDEKTLPWTSRTHNTVATSIWIDDSIPDLNLDCGNSPHDVNHLFSSCRDHSLWNYHKEDASFLCLNNEQFEWHQNDRYKQRQGDELSWHCVPNADDIDIIGRLKVAV